MEQGDFRKYGNLLKEMKTTKSKEVGGRNMAWNCINKIVQSNLGETITMYVDFPDYLNVGTYASLIESVGRAFTAQEEQWSNDLQWQGTVDQELFWLRYLRKLANERMQYLKTLKEEADKERERR